jgi:hypothetical protein
VFSGNNARGRSSVVASKIFWIVVLVIGVSVGGFFGIRYLIRQSQLSAFTQRINEYTAQPAGVAPPELGAYVVGKIIPVDMRDSKKIDWLYYDLPGELQPSTPEEVGTIVWLFWGEQQVGKYTTGGGAYVRTCRVTVIDRIKNVRVTEMTFQGGQPPQTIRGSGNGYGDYPTEQIVNWLKSLPRR